MAVESKAWVVALSFEGGGVTIGTTFAPAEQGAIALAALDAGRNLPNGALVGMNALELSEEFLRTALRMIEGGDKPKVVSLVSDNLRPLNVGEVLSQEEMDARARVAQLAQEQQARAMQHYGEVLRQAQGEPLKDDPA